MSDWKMTIGIECHVQLATKSKLFSSADNDARDREPNSVVDPIDYGLPGMLPLLNEEAINLAIRAAKALNAKVAKVSRFDRKHYFYPDLPMGYQITQMYQPTIGAGHVDVPLLDGSSLKVRIHHAHIESDAGKQTHYKDHTLVDLNRAGTPLIEIVSEPDIHSAAEARAYCSELHKLMTYAGVTLGDLYHGNMRFDVNISVAKADSDTLGKRAEIKNLNSFRSVERAAEYEFKRQVALLEKGETVVQETRGWSDDTQRTTSQRSKEDAQDYRYMPDADIPPVVLNDAYIASIQSNMPYLPPHFRSGWADLNLGGGIVDTILGYMPVAKLLNDMYPLPAHKDQLLAQMGVAETEYREYVIRIFNWFASTPYEQMNLDKVTEGLIGPHRLMELAKLVASDKLSSTSAKQIFLDLFDENFKGVMPDEIATRKGLLQESDETAIASIVDEIMADGASQKSIADIRAGNDKAIGFLVGQVMKKSAGKANPALAQKLIRERL